MSIGRPDWYRAGRSQSVASMDDLGELAVRLGSGVNFDRTGKVLFADYFTYLHDLLTVTEVGPSVAGVISGTGGEAKDSCYDVTLGVGTSNRASLSRNIRTYTSGLLSFEVGFNTITTPSQILLSFWLEDGARSYRFGLRYLSSTEELSYLDSGGSYTAFADIGSNAFNIALIHALKLDVDMDNHVYVRVRLDHETYDLSGISPLDVASTAYPDAYLAFWVYGHASATVRYRLDRWIVTLDE